MALDVEGNVSGVEKKEKSKSNETAAPVKKKGNNNNNNNKKKTATNASNGGEKKKATGKNDQKTVTVNGHSKLNGHLKENGVENESSSSSETELNGDHGTIKETVTTTAVTDDENKIESIEQSSVLEIIQDSGFTVEIMSPGNSEPLSIQVSSMELVQEIHQLLMDREDTCHRTCFSLQLDGVTLDNFAELKNIEGLKEGSTIRVVEEPYTMREARIHVRHVRDLLKSMDPADAYNGIDCCSLTFLHTITGGDILEKKKSRPDIVDCTPPENIMPGSKDRPLLQLQPGIKNTKIPQPIKILTTSAWNPPPGPRKLHGDLMYLYVVTMEEKRFHISACPRGFFLNQSTDEIFNPKPAQPSHLSHSLIDLLSQISPTFKRCFGQMQKNRTQRHPFERVATPYQVYAWSAPSLEHTIDAIRAEDTFSSKLGYEEHIPGQTRDWNEELQTTRELPRSNLPERLLRERAIFKVHSDFVTAATRGAMAVIDGNVMAINPGEDPKMQMFIWNNIFFSLGFDVREHYKELGGDAAAFIAPRNDLHGVRVYSAVDVEGLYTLGTVVIDYRGYRVTAQSIIPGILEREQEQSVVYGSIDFGKTILSHPKYLELLHKAGQHLKILPHSVFNDKDEEIELCSSVECKGIIGNDGRHYILDLLRTFPPDVNFMKLNDPSVELSDDIKQMGFPIVHKHKLCCLRQELLEAFTEDRYVMFIKHAAYHLQQANILKKTASASATDNKQAAIEEQKKEEQTTPSSTEGDDEVKVKQEENTDEKNNNAATAGATASDDGNVIDKKLDDAKKFMETISDSIRINDKQAAMSKDVVKKACTAVGSLKEFEFDIRFNPDVFSPGIRHVDHTTNSNNIKKQKTLVRDAAEFLVIRQIPAFVNDFLDHSSPPMDGVVFSEALHTRGINIRYLGKVANLLAKIDQLEYLHTIAMSELILRATKHIFTTYVQNIEIINLASAISHFLNCFLQSVGSVVSSPQLGIDELQKSSTTRRKNKNNSSNGGGGSSGPQGTRSLRGVIGKSSDEWTQLTQKSLWQLIKKELKYYWDYELTSENIDVAVESYKLQKISLLRSFSIKVGLQILIREYNFEAKNKPTFNEDDILNVFPVVKHINPRATDAYNFYTTGQNKIQHGHFKEGFELISEALNLLNNVYGAMHPENAQCLRMLARLSYIMGDSQEALAIQQRAVLMSERVNGIDHPHTIMEYAHLGLYCFANNQVTTALKLLYRARYLLLLVFGENHPDMAMIDSNIALILHSVGEYELSLRFLEDALNLNIKYYGEKSIKVAVSYHLVARTQSCLGDFRSALNNEKETYAIYKQQLGENHEKTQESSECLKHLTRQAVVLQKQMNDIYTNGKLTSGLPPIQIQPPSMAVVLEMLNAINGILFIQISSKEIANLKNEIEKRQKESNVILENQEAVEKIISSTRDEAVAAEVAAAAATTTTTGTNDVKSPTIESNQTKTS